MPTPTIRRDFERGLRWVLPSGNLGDALLLSSVLKAGLDRTGERVGVVRLQPFASLFLDHPAVAQLASIDLERSPVQRTDYWNLDFPEVPGASRAFGRLSALLYGEPFADEAIWAPVGDADRAVLAGLPIRAAPILLAASPDSPRREWPRPGWAELAERLAAAAPGVPLVQVGLAPAPGIPGTLNLTGRLSPRQLLAVAERAIACVAVDPFLALAARRAGVPCVNLHGPTSAAAYAPLGQAAVGTCAPCAQPCLDGRRDAGMKPCVERPHCMSRLAAADVVDALRAAAGAALAETPLLG